MTATADAERTAWQNWRMCERKKSYTTRSKAVKFGHSRGLRAYECPVCHTWHLTSKPLLGPIQETMDLTANRETTQ